MATFENIGLCFQLVNNVYGLVNNMRDNANSYKQQVQLGRPLAGIASIMVSDANLYLIRIQKITDLATRNMTAFTDALQALGLTVAAANSLKNTLTTVANHTISATLVSDTDINTESDFILANVPNLERIF